MSHTFKSALPPTVVWWASNDLGSVMGNGELRAPYGLVLSVAKYVGDCLFQSKIHKGCFLREARLLGIRLPNGLVLHVHATSPPQNPHGRADTINTDVDILKFKCPWE